MIKFKDFPEKYKVRSTGWIQDVSNFDNLHKFVSLFSHNSFYREELVRKINELVIDDKKTLFLNYLQMEMIVIPYVDIVGSSPKGSRRTETKCNGIGQASLDGQKMGRNFQGDWSTDSFLRLAETLMLIKGNYIDDTYEITEVGEKYVKCETLSDKNSVLRNQLAFYPPAVKILSLLREEPLSKFQIGKELSKVSSKGFTNVSQEAYIEKYLSTPKSSRIKIRCDYEGSADKYARQICTWMLKLGLIDKGTNIIEKDGDRVRIPSYYIINELGLQFLEDFESSPKFAPFGMLAIGVNDKKNHCRRRGIILNCLSDWSDTTKIITYLNSFSIKSNADEIINDINSLRAMGIPIASSKELFKCNVEIIGLVIPLNN